MALAEIERRQLAVGRSVGLAHALPAEEFDDWAADLWSRVRTRVLAADPAAARVLEKSPEHARHLDLIRRLAPGARFVLLVRNPLDVVRSTVEAGRGWGHDWAPTSVELATGRYRRTMQIALSSALPDDTFVVRYEDLLGDPTAWAPLLRFIGIEPDWELPPLDLPPRELGRFVTPVGITTDRSTARFAAADGFSFHHRSRRHELSKWERHYVAAYCGELMQRFGYAPADARLTVIDRVRYSFRAVRRNLGPLLRRARR